MFPAKHILFAIMLTLQVHNVVSMQTWLSSRCLETWKCISNELFTNKPCFAFNAIRRELAYAGEMQTAATLEIKKCHAERKFHSPDLQVSGTTCTNLVFEPNLHVTHIPALPTAVSVPNNQENTKYCWRMCSLMCMYNPVRTFYASCNLCKVLGVSLYFLPSFGKILNVRRGSTPTFFKIFSIAQRHIAEFTCHTL